MSISGFDLGVYKPVKGIGIPRGNFSGPMLLDKLNREGRLIYAPDAPGVKPQYVQFKSTRVLVWPHFFTEDGEKLIFKHVIDRAVNICGVVIDYENLNALAKIPERVPDDYVLLGLMMYLTLEGSRTQEYSKTFLTACREVGMQVYPGETLDEDYEDRFKNKFIEVLKHMGLYDNAPEMKNIPEDWRRRNTFKVKGADGMESQTFTYYPESNEFVTQGGYAKLAKTICAMDGLPDIQINCCVSFMLSVAEKMKEFQHDDVAGYEFIKSICEDEEFIRQHVENGHKIKTGVLRRKSCEIIGKGPYPSLSHEGYEQFRFIERAPSYIQQIFYHSKHYIAFTPEKDIDGILPDSPFIQGFTRTSAGNVMSGNLYLAMSAGIGSAHLTPEQKEERKLGVFCHEAGHIALKKFNMKDSYYDMISEAIDELHNSNSQDVKAIMNRRTLVGVGLRMNQVLNNYIPEGDEYTAAAWREEVFCNLLFLRSTKSPLHELFYYASEDPAVKKLGQALDMQENIMNEISEIMTRENAEAQSYERGMQPEGGFVAALGGYSPRFSPVPSIAH